MKLHILILILLFVNIFGMSDEDLKLNQRYKDEKKLKDEGYKQEDIAKILDGAPKR